MFRVKYDLSYIVFTNIAPEAPISLFTRARVPMNLLFIGIKSMKCYTIVQSLFAAKNKNVAKSISSVCSCIAARMTIQL